VSQSKKILCLVYFSISIIALISCWYQNLFYIPEGLIQGTLHFSTDTFANPASRSITLDIIFLFLSCSIWMVSEAKKLNIPHVWAYVLFGLLVAISVTFPLFLIVREIKLGSKSLETT